MVVRHSPGSHRLTLGANKAYDVHELADEPRDLNVTPRIANLVFIDETWIKSRTAHCADRGRRAPGSRALRRTATGAP
jgi:hypothetical protein